MTWGDVKAQQQALVAASWWKIIYISFICQAHIFFASSSIICETVRWEGKNLCLVSSQSWHKGVPKVENFNFQNFIDILWF